MDNQWKLPILGSILIHVLLLGGSIFSTYFFPDKKIEEIHTVDLVNIEEYHPPKKQKKTEKPKVAKPRPPKPKASPKPEPRPEKISESPPKEVIPENPTGPPEEVISIKPRLTKKEINSPEKKRTDEQINRALEKIRREMQRKRAEEKARQAEEEARAYAREAVRDLSDILRAGETEKNAAEAPEERTTSANDVRESAKEGGREDVQSGGAPAKAVLKQYLAAIFREIQANWILPEVTDWQGDLEAVISITVTREGTVIKSKFERPSRNIYFNRFVEKTIKRSSPLPPIPDILEKEQLEIGLIFHPEGLE